MKENLKDFSLSWKLASVSGTILVDSGVFQLCFSVSHVHLLCEHLITYEVQELATCSRGQVLGDFNSAAQFV